MMCYKDRCYCPFFKDCTQGDVCRRALTEEVLSDAMMVNMPIDQFAERPECFDECD